MRRRRERREKERGGREEGGEGEKFRRARKFHPLASFSLSLSLSLSQQKVYIANFFPGNDPKWRERALLGLRNSASAPALCL